MGNTPTAICEDCGKEIRGRSDKRFCDDTCRNNFNREKRQAENVPISEEALEVLRLIKRNYRILKSSGPPTNHHDYLNAADLLEKGFNPNYFTSTAEINGKPYNFCFEMGFRVVDGYIDTVERWSQMELRN